MLQKTSLSFLILLLLVALPDKIVVSAEQESDAEKSSVWDMLEETEENTPVPNEETPDQENNLSENEVPIAFENELTWVDGMKTVFALVIVIGLIVFILKFINKKNRSYAQLRSLENLGGISLGTNRSVQLVKVGNRILVLGVGESIQLLKEIEDESEVVSLIEKQQIDIPPLLSDNLLSKWFKQKKLEDQEEGLDSTDFKSMFKDQLNQMSEGRQRLFKDVNERGKDDE